MITKALLFGLIATKKEPVDLSILLGRTRGMRSDLKNIHAIPIWANASNSVPGPTEKTPQITAEGIW